MTDSTAGSQAAPEALAEACTLLVTQAHRTADWLASRPLPRLAADGGRVPEEARTLIDTIDQLTRSACRGCTEQVCPPHNARPHHLADASVGVQLRVMTNNFADVVSTCGTGQLTLDHVQRAAHAALDLRRRG